MNNATVPKSVIGISGKQGSGKTALASMLVQHFNQIKHSTAEVVKFAQPIYDIHDFALKTCYPDGSVTLDKTLLQILGTEWGRQRDDNIWVNAWYERVSDSPREMIITDDMRFSNELGKVMFMNSITVRLECSEEIRKARTEGWRDNTEHPSETALDGHLDAFNLVINVDDKSAEEVLNIVLAELGYE